MRPCEHSFLLVLRTPRFPPLKESPGARACLGSALGQGHGHGHGHGHGQGWVSPTKNTFPQWLEMGNAGHLFLKIHTSVHAGSTNQVHFLSLYGNPPSSPPSTRMPPPPLTAAGCSAMAEVSMCWWDRGLSLDGDLTGKSDRTAVLPSALKIIAVRILQMCWCHDLPPTEKRKTVGQHSGFSGSSWP